MTLNTPRETICSGNTTISAWGNSFCKITGRKALILMEQDSTRGKIVSTLKYGNRFNVDIKILILILI